MITFKEEELTLLPNQGHCNENFLLQKGGKKYHVRRFKLANMDRVFEYKVQKLAYKNKIAAKPFYLNERIMIGAFIEGVHKNKLPKHEIRKLANIIKKLHKIKLRKKPVKLPKEVMRKSKKFKKEYVLCHGDLNIKNILFGKTPKLIDWEYAGINDKYFDLATVSKEFKFSKMEEACFLRAYGNKINFEKLEVYKEIYEILYKQWFEKLEKGKFEFLA